VNTEYGNLVKQTSPNPIVSGRLKGNKDIADYRSEGDRRIPKARVTGDVETPMTMRDNWGYDRDESNWKSLKDMLERFSLTACRGANMLLNVGPTPDGTFTPEEIALLKGIGGWMEVNQEAVYGTAAGPFDFDFEWGSIAQKPGKLYLHVLKWDAGGIGFDGLKTRVKKAHLLADKEQSGLSVEQDLASGTITVKGPREAPSDLVNVIVLELDGELKTDPNATGEYVWFKDIDIRQNKAKMEKQKALGWAPNWSWDKPEKPTWKK
jgi:alpha-L-fucosidase